MSLFAGCNGLCPAGVAGQCARSPPRSAVVTYGGGAKPLAARGMPFGERRAAAALSFARRRMHYPLHRFGGMVYTVILQRARPKVKHKAHSAAFARAKNLHNLSYKRKDLFMEM